MDLNRFGYGTTHKAYFPTIREKGFDVHSDQVGDIEDFGYFVHHPVIQDKDKLYWYDFEEGIAWDNESNIHEENRDARKSNPLFFISELHRLYKPGKAILAYKVTMKGLDKDPSYIVFQDYPMDETGLPVYNLVIANKDTLEPIYDEKEAIEYLKNLYKEN